MIPLVINTHKIRGKHIEPFNAEHDLCPVIQLAREHNSRTPLTAITYNCLPNISTTLSTPDETTNIGPLLQYARRV